MTEPPKAGNESGTLVGFLDLQRSILEAKCGGLTDDQLRAALPPSSITLGGLLQHLACVEDSWITETIAGLPLPEPWASVDFEADPDWTWHSAATQSGDELRTRWADRVGRSRTLLATHLAELGDAALSRTHAAYGYEEPVSLRWVLTHLIEEYARHLGHADLIREAIDGQTDD